MTARHDQSDPGVRDRAAARPDLARQSLRFAVVGVLNTATCLGLVFVLGRVPGFAVWLASTVGYAIATLQSYLLNRNWTFGATAGGAAAGGPAVAAQFGSFVAVNLVVGMIFAGLNALLVGYVPLAVSTLIALAVIIPTSFVAQRFLVFGGGRQWPNQWHPR